ncbi:beta-lactamase/transpeptidase-like protein [Lophiostoma macrostomum CBS 122681]|uniref:Beta-lactamase/transpeptidase-like protein n=1 Tax=Lophiostoma macrostomum CBS 122681 TaxID=1314788 RepID=A0A6A6TAD2_9PLEO|nr:beta-lactamase/transpeptidase-like protein [Lophiostoma macrostomum CBS 122681]
MKTPTLITILPFLSHLSLIIPPTTALPNCPLAGPESPPPQNLSSHPTWQRALSNLTTILHYLDLRNTLLGQANTSYSLQIFSTNPGSPILWERHGTSPNLLPDTPGVKAVGPDTVYRIGSVSKVFAVLAFLVSVSDIYWTWPITSFIPELAVYAGHSSSTTPDFDAVRSTSWDEITIGALASQVSGLGRDYGVLGELTQTPDLPAFSTLGLETLGAADVPPCGAWPLCTRAEFFAGLGKMYPSYAPWETPTYSNIAYQLLAYALENVTGRTFEEVLQEGVVKPLGLTRTYYRDAPVQLGVVPGNLSDSYWGVGLGDASPGGNMYSSPNDLSTLGRAILSSALLRPAQTRRWLSPVEFTSDFAASVGAPWGIRRIQLDAVRQPYRTLSVFTKAGSFRSYTAFLSLLKDFNLGFTILTAGDPSVSNFQIADILGESVIPAYQSVARDEADKLYSGTYISDDGLVVINTSPAKLGLGVISRLSNGTNMVEMGLRLAGSSDTQLSWKARPEVRLYYTQLESKTADGGKRQSWKAVFEDTAGSAGGQHMFSSSCGSWVGVTGVTYGSLPLDEFIFNFDGQGRVIAPKPKALVARASYSVVNVDGGSSTAAPDATTVVQQHTNTATETVKVTQVASTVTDNVTSTIVKTTATPAPAPAPTTTLQSSSALTKPSASTSAPSSSTVPSSSSTSSSSSAPPSSSQPPSSSATATPVVNTSVLTVTVTESAGPTDWYDNGMWHTSYRVKTFGNAEVATATSSGLASR